uniref:CASPASE_P20 domain-containing protein n=1 Tax=Macrostomum lignano TaxID=282301 RepID=A0A1I8G143_9PLAT
MKRLFACTCWSSGRQKRGGFDVGDCDTAGSQQKTCTPPSAPSAQEATISRSSRRRYALVFCFFHQQFESTSSSAAQRAARDLLRGLGFITHSFFNLDKLDDILSELR